MFFTTNPSPKRKRGAQPGNQNARKHTAESNLETENQKDSKRKSGGQPGNINARTHGFYARRLPAI
jgi:hypothetical protein